jgi:DDE superfamily endonuclease
MGTPQTFPMASVPTQLIDGGSRLGRDQDVHCDPAQIHQVEAGYGLEGVRPLVSTLVHLPALLAGPEPSGGADSFRRYQGCSRPSLRPQGQAALSFSRPLRQPTGGVLSSPHGQTAPRGAQLEIHYTPKHASWLNMAETELSVLSGQCLDRRIPDRNMLVREVTAWMHDRNVERSTIDWRFTTPDSRIKLKRLYPAILP